MMNELPEFADRLSQMGYDGLRVTRFVSRNRRKSMFLNGCETGDQPWRCATVRLDPFGNARDARVDTPEQVAGLSIGTFPQRC